MSIQKKSLISTLKAAKKANVAKADVVEAHKGEKQVSAYRVTSSRLVNSKSFKHLRVM